MIIVIDGPAGSGKSSTAKAVAEQTNIQYLDSGALYRAATLIFIEAKQNRTKFFERLESINISFYYKKGGFYISIDDRDVTKDIRTMLVSNSVSEVASSPEVRSFINGLMNAAINKGNYIADGRDLGTAVFPNADLKFYMIADLKTRAKRRMIELKNQGSDVTLEQILLSISERDQKDSSRKADPLKKAKDAIEIDTSTYKFEEQVNFISEKVFLLLKET